MRAHPATAALALAALTLAGMAAAPALAGTLSLEDFFKGRTYASGAFSAINGQNRSFTVVLDGKWDGKVLRLREDFVFSDGERDRKTWVFTKTGPNTYSGTREDVIGAVPITVNGGRAEFSYKVNIAKSGDPEIVRFHDTLELGADGIVRNTATVTKFLIPVAWVKVNFARTEALAGANKP